MIKNIFAALGAYSQSFSLIGKLKLWKFFLIPMGISLLVAVSVYLSIYQLADNIGRWISSFWPWDAGQETVTAISTWLGGFIILILGFILYKHIVMTLSAPFMSPVSEKMERHLFPEVYEDIKQRNTSHLEQFMRSLRLSVRNLIYELMITLPLLILSLIPGVNLVTAVLIFLVQAYYSGFGNMDYTLERHFAYRESVSFVKKSRGYAIGNGIVFTALTFIPVIGIILVLPISVTAASKTTLELLKERKMLLASSKDLSTSPSPLRQVSH